MTRMSIYFFLSFQDHSLYLVICMTYFSSPKHISFQYYQYPLVQCCPLSKISLSLKFPMSKYTHHAVRKCAFFSVQIFQQFLNSHLFIIFQQFLNSHLFIISYNTIKEIFLQVVDMSYRQKCSGNTIFLFYVTKK